MTPAKRQNDASAPDPPAKRQKEPPGTLLKKSKIVAGLDEIANQQKVDHEPGDEDTAGETTVAGRPRGAKNYSASELKALISCVDEVVPIGSQGFGEVANLYNRVAKEKGWAHRSEKPLRQRWDKLRTMKPNSGNPEIDKLHKAALVVAQKVEAESGIRVTNDGPARKLHLKEAYRKIVQDDDEDPDLVTEMLPPGVHIKHSNATPHDNSSVIDLTDSSDESSKATVKQEPADDIIVAREKEKGKGVSKPKKVSSGGGNIVTKTYRHGNGKTTGRTAVTETVLGAVANHLSPEAQEKREISRINLFRESRHQDRQDRVLEEREREMNKIIGDLRHENEVLRERATSAETRLSIACSYGFSPVPAPFTYQHVPTTTQAAYPPSARIQTTGPFVADPSQYTVLPTIYDCSEPEGSGGPRPQTTEHWQWSVGANNTGEWNEE